MSHTIAENLSRLQVARTDIASAITAKGGTVNTGDGFEEFPADIATIPSGGSPAPEPMPAVFRNHALGSASLRIADPPLFHASAETTATTEEVES